MTTRAALALIAALPIAASHAAPEAADVECRTFASTVADFRSRDPDTVVTRYTGTDARAFLKALLVLSPNPPTRDLSQSSLIATFKSSDVGTPVFVVFFDVQGCAIYAVSGSPAALDLTIQHMGIGA